MRIISISTDLGENNFGLAQFQARLTSSFPQSQILNLFHHSESFDVESIAYHIYGAIKTFPEESIHLIYCKYSISKFNLLISKINQQYIITPNNGLFSLLHSIDYNAKVYSLEYGDIPFDYTNYQSNFLKGLNLIFEDKYAAQLNEINTFVQSKPFNTDLVFSDDRIITRVLYTDKLGNIILNILEEDFYQYLDGKAFHILFHMVKIDVLSPNYMTSYNTNRIGAIFNEAGFLEIFMIGGNLSKLFNINKWTNNKFEIYKDNDTNRQINFQVRT